MLATPRFLSLPNADLDSADVVILPVPYERTVTYRRGTAEGPAAILAASEQLEFYEEDRAWSPALYMRHSVQAPVSVVSETEAGFHEQLFREVVSLPEHPLFIALGGEHSITPALVFARMPEGGTVVQIDAHADLRAEYHGSVFNHACPMYRIWKRGYRLIQIGIRSLHAEEARIIDEADDITTYFDRGLGYPDRWQALLSHLDNLSGPVWLTIDLDGLDPSLIPGVGTPQPGGLSWYQVLDIVDSLTTHSGIVLRGIDIVELIPDANKVSDIVAAKLVQKCISYWGMARGFHRRNPEGSQCGIDDE
ncbi:MAG: agmatinase [Gammaproteobacteria bacterium]|nr:agmatinase [Gammaproteobacteria bacterium]